MPAFKVFFCRGMLALFFRCLWCNLSASRRMRVNRQSCVMLQYQNASLIPPFLPDFPHYLALC